MDKWLKMSKAGVVCDFMARDQFLESRNRVLYVTLKPETFRTLNGMARGGVSSCVIKGQRESKGAPLGKPDKSDNKATDKTDFRFKICGKGIPI